MPYPNEHAYRLKSPGLFDKKSFRTTAGGSLYGGKVTVPKTINIIWAKLQGRAKPSDPPMVQSLRFKRASWSVSRAKAWIKSNITQKGTFEPAASTATEQSARYDPGDEVIWDDANQYEAGEVMEEGALVSIFGEDGETAIPNDGETAIPGDDGETAEGEDTIEEAARQEKQLLAANDGETSTTHDGETAEGEEQPEESSTESGDDNPASSREDESPETYDEDLEEDSEDEENDQETYTVEGVEIFETGTHNGEKYSPEDLDLIVENFTKLRKYVKPPAKLGHGDQTLLRESGLPAAGWVKALRRVGKKLVADITDVPRAVYKAIKRKAYKRISSEIYFNYQDQRGKRHGLVLAAIAILGGDIPAVKSLKDIEALYAENAHDNEIRTVTYTMPEKVDKTQDTLIDEEPEETPEEEVTEEEAAEEEEEATEEEEEETPAETEQAPAEMSEGAKKQLLRFEQIIKAQDAKITKLTADAEAEREAAAIEKDELFLDKLTEQGIFPPALREKSLLLMSALRQDDNVLKFTEQVDGQDVEIESSPFEAFTSILETLPTQIDMSETAQGDNTAPGSQRGKGKDDKRYKNTNDRPVKDVEVAIAADKYFEEHKAEGIEYSEAIAAVSREV